MIQQFRQAIRSLSRRPAAAIMPVFVLTLGIGASTAIFSIINGALLRPLPGVRQPQELVLLQRVQDGQLLGNFGYPDYLDYRRQTRVLGGLAATVVASLSYTQSDTTERIRGSLVSGDYFSLLGVEAVAGRMLTREDEDARADNVVLSYRLFRRDFGGDPNAVLGRPIQLNGHTSTIVGIAPKDFIGTTIGSSTDVWLPVTTQPKALPYMSQDILQNRAAGWLILFGRLRPGVRIEQAQSELGLIASSLAETYPETNSHRNLRVFSDLGMDPENRDQLTRFLASIFASVVLLLLIACGNVSSLLLARGISRGREIAVRAALGASRSHLFGQLLSEALLLAAAACVLGLIVASFLSPVIAAWQPGSYGLQNLDVSPDLRVFAFAVIAALVVAIPCALAPIWQASKVDLARSLKQGTAGAGRQTTFFRSALVVGQVALSVVLLIGAGLVARTMHRLLNSDQGFDTKHIALLSLDLTTNGYTNERGRIFYDQLLHRVQALPGVVAASLASSVPPAGFSNRRAIFYPGQQPADIQGREFDPGNLRVDSNNVGPGYLRSMGIELVRGRDFTPQDRQGAVAVAVVTDRLAERLWPGEDAIGKQLSVPEFAGIADPAVKIIGIARSTKDRSLLETPPPILYLPLMQRYSGRATLVVRTAGDPAASIPEFTRQIHELDKNLPVFAIETMQAHIAGSLWQQHIASALIGLFGILAAILASVGLYGIVAHGVAERVREIGIRVALGGRASNIRRMVFRQGLTLVASGITLGLGLAYGLTRFLAGLLYEISPHDVLTYFTVCVLLCAVAFLASEIPARRALNIDPVIALRSE
jgi:macrolide transport system ATP-binding/permease protein